MTRLRLKPVGKERENIEQMYGTVNKVVEIFQCEAFIIVFPEFSIEMECINAESITLHTFKPKY